MPLVKGPFVLTDAAVNPACPNTLFLAAGQPEAPRWIAVNPSRSGSRLVVKAGETLTGGVLAQEEKEAVKDGRCAITWYGFRFAKPQNPINYLNQIKINGIINVNKYGRKS